MATETELRKETKHYKNESPEYRAAREKLLQSEVALREMTEAVARERRALPLGGRVPENYVFEEMTPDGKTRSVKMSDLFAPGKDTLIVYSYMYGPKMANPCVMCTSIVDGLNANAPHVTQRVNLVAVAKSPIERFMNFARGRGWDKIRLLSSSQNTYNRDYFGEDEKEAQWPMANVFVKRGDAIHHTWGSELIDVKFPGGNERHVDIVWPLWNLFDWTPEGRGTDWYPKLQY
jgi:predicted dithiol-disulfide oxidoreductase (DUF899 family)